MSTYDELVQNAIMGGVEPIEARRRAALATGTPVDPDDQTVEELKASLRDMPREAFEQSTRGQGDWATWFNNMTPEEQAEQQAKWGLDPKVAAMSSEEQSAHWADQRAEAVRLKAATTAREAAVKQLIASGIDKDTAERSVADVSTFMPEVKGPSEVEKLRANLRAASRTDMGLPEEEDAEAAAAELRRQYELSRQAGA